MKRIYVAVLLTACGGSSGGTSAVIDDTILAITHEGGSDPHGYLQVQAGGQWMYSNSDACRFIKGDMEPTTISEIGGWVNDESLKSYVSMKACPDTDYVVRSANSRMCWPQDAMPQSESGQALFALFRDTAAKFKWDGVKRECDSPNLTAVPSGNTKQTDPPPPSRMPAAGSGT